MPYKNKKLAQAVKNRWARETYRKEMDALIKDMGGKCVKCGSEERLEVDHIYGRDWDLKKVHIVQRVRKYRGEWEQGKTRLLCKHCNMFRWKEEDYNDVPF